jgi:hypothetical protein
VTESLVAVPNVSWISAVWVNEVGDVIVAVRVFRPVSPTMDSPVKVATPATADLVAVPEITEFETLNTIDEVFPVMTLLFASLTRITTSEIVMALAAFSGATNSRLSTAPGVKVIDWVADEIPAVVLEKVRV